MTSQMTIASKPILYSVTEETIKQMSVRFQVLKIGGIDDVEGYETVHKARMECVKARSAIEKTRKELKAESLEFGRKVDNEAKLLTSKIEDIEKRLTAEQKRIDDEKAAIELERQDKIVADRIEKLRPYPQSIRSDAVLRSMSPKQFDEYLEEAIKSEDERIERERIAKEQAEANRIEQEKLKAERAAFEAEQAKIKAEQDRLAKIEADKRAAEQAEIDRQRAEIQAEKLRLAKIEFDRLESERLEKAKAEAAEKARIETEARLKREAEEAERKRIEDEAAAKRAEELKPVKQKIFEFAVYVRDLELPDVGDTEKKLITNILDIAGRAIHDVGKGLK